MTGSGRTLIQGPWQLGVSDSPNLRDVRFDAQIEPPIYPQLHPRKAAHRPGLLLVPPPAPDPQPSRRPPGSHRLWRRRLARRSLGQRPAPRHFPRRLPALPGSSPSGNPRTDRHPHRPRLGHPGRSPRHRHAPRQPPHPRRLDSTRQTALVRRVLPVSGKPVWLDQRPARPRHRPANRPRRRPPNRPPHRPRQPQRPRTRQPHHP